MLNYAALGPEVLVNQQTSANQLNPKVHVLQSGGYVVTWTDLSASLGDASYSSIKAQLFSASGARIGQEFLVNTNTPGNQLAPVIASLGNGGFVIIWMDSSDQLFDLSGFSVKAQMFDASGIPVGMEILVNTETTNSQWYPTATGLLGGGFVVAWKDESAGQGGADGTGAVPSDTDVSSIKAQIFDAAGSPVGVEFTVNSEFAGEQAAPQITKLAGGGFVVAWQDFGSTNGLPGAVIKARIFDSLGNASGNEFTLVSTETSSQSNLTLAGLAGGGFVATWQDSAGSLGDSDTGIKAQIFNAQGAPVGAGFLVNTQTQGLQTSPSVSSLSNGGFVVSWTEANVALGDGSRESIKAQVFDSFGARIGSELIVNSEVQGAQQFSSSAGLLDGKFVIAWQDSGGTLGDISGTSVKARTFDVATNLTAPVITSNEGLPVAKIAAAVGNTLVANIVAVDQDPNSKLSYSITGGADAHLFTIDPATGTLRFKTPPSVSNPRDAGRNGIYDVVVQVTDGLYQDQQIFSVSVGSAGSGANLNYVNGGITPETLTGLPGKVNLIVGAGGEDTIVGASRADIASFSGRRSDYTVTSVAGVTTVVDNRPGSPDGTDTLLGVNILRFADLQLFLTSSANKMSLAGQKQSYQVGNNEVVQGTNAAEHFLIYPGSSSLLFVGANDIVDLPDQIYNYTFTANGNLLQISDGNYSTTLAVGGSFTLRTATGATTVAIDFAAGGAIVLGGSQIVGSNTFDAFSALLDPANVSASTLFTQSRSQPTVDIVSTLDRTPTLSGSVTLKPTEALNVSINGQIFSSVTREVIVERGIWTLNLPTELAPGVYDVTAHIVQISPAPPAVITGTPDNEVLTGSAGVVNQFSGGAGNDTIYGGSRADIALYSGVRSDYTVSTVAGVTTVVDNRPGSPDGTDTLQGINILRFDDIQLFVTAAANKVTLAGQPQTYQVLNSEVVQGTNAAERFVVSADASPLIFAGKGDIVDLSDHIYNYVFKSNGNLLQISDATYTITLAVGGQFTLRTATGSTSVAIDFAAGGVVVLGGTQVVGSDNFDAFAAITNLVDVSENGSDLWRTDSTVAEAVILEAAPTVVQNSQNYTANPGKMDVFVIKSDIRFPGVLSQFEKGDVLVFEGIADGTPVSISNGVIGDGSVTLTSGSLSINLINLPNDNFTEIESLGQILGASAIRYVI